MNNKHYDYVALAMFVFGLGTQVGVTFQPCPVSIIGRIVVGIVSLFCMFVAASLVRAKLKLAREALKDSDEDLERLRRFNHALRETAGPAATDASTAMTDHTVN